MRRGRRIRRIRQSSVAGAAAIAVFGITATGVAFAGRDDTQVVHPASGGVGLTVSSPSPVPGTTSIVVPISPPASSPAASTPPVPASTVPVAAASSISTASCSVAPQSEVGAPSANPDGNAPPWGTPIQVGSDGGNSVVLYGIHISDAAIPCTHFGMMLGTTDSAGATSGVTGMYTGSYEANETDGSDLTPGMHAVSLSGGGNQISAWYLIGYYVGSATSVFVEEKAFASPVAATVVPWSVNPD